MFDVCGKGTIVFNLLNMISKCIEDVLHVPKLTKNLLSITQLIKQSLKVEFEATKCQSKSFDSTKVIIEIVQEGRLYKLIGIVQSLVAKRAPSLKRMTCIKDLDMSFYKL